MKLLAHLMGVEVEGKEFNVDNYVFLSSHSSDSVSLYVSKTAVGWLPLNYTHKTGLKLKYDLYFAGSDDQPLLRKTADFKIAEWALKGQFFRSYRSSYAAMTVLHRVVAVALAVNSLCSLGLPGGWRYIGALHSRLGYRLRNIPHSKWVGQGEG